AELARQVRRPMPRPPASQARRGTAFHQWLEQRYGQQMLIDDNALFGPEDDEAPGEGDLAVLRSRFEHSEWADRWRHAVSVQLAAYRLAWAALAGVPVAAVRAAFYYVAHDQTVRPADLLDAAGL